MPWKHASLSKSHFWDELSALLYIFIDELFAFTYTFMDELIRTRKCTNTKKTRKKDEENTKETRNFACFSSDEGENQRAKTARWSVWKISGLNWTTETKGSKWPDEIKGSKRAFDQLVKVAKWLNSGVVETQPDHFVPGWREVTNFIAGCDEVALKSATSYFFGKPIDKIRSVWYTLIKEVEVLL